jgi:hypothetical protein
MGSSQIPFVFHVTVALVLSPFWSNKTNGVVLEVPLASFQFDWATTPATSVLPIAVPSPTNLIPIAAAFATLRVTLAVWVKLPLVPVMVSGYVPSGVVELVVTVSVEVPDPVTVAGEKLAVAPAGSPLALSVTTPLNPFSAPMLVVKVVAFPTTTVCELGVAVRLKFGGGWVAATVKLTLAVWVKLPLVPVIVSVDVPSGVVPLVVTVSVELPEPVTVAGEKLAVAPAGNPLALSVTAPLKPSTAPMLVVKVVAFPTTTVCELGVAVRLKVGVVGARGTIWMALTGARGSESVDAPGVAVIVNPVAVMVNST